MARIKEIFLQGMSGAIGKQVVIKQYSYGTVVTSYPDMSKVKRSPLQKSKQKVFAKAVEYAREIINNPVKKEAYAKKLKKNTSVYHAAIREYLNKNTR